MLHGICACGATEYAATVWGRATAKHDGKAEAAPLAAARAVALDGLPRLELAPR